MAAMTFSSHLCGTVIPCSDLVHELCCTRCEHAVLQLYCSKLSCHLINLVSELHPVPPIPTRSFLLAPQLSHAACFVVRRLPSWEYKRHETKPNSVLSHSRPNKPERSKQIESEPHLCCHLRSLRAIVTRTTWVLSSSRYFMYFYCVLIRGVLSESWLFSHAQFCLC